MPILKNYKKPYKIVDSPQIVLSLPLRAVSSVLAPRAVDKVNPQNLVYVIGLLQISALDSISIKSLVQLEVARATV